MTHTREIVAIPFLTPPPFPPHRVLSARVYRLTAAQTFEHWDAPFVRWLEGNGYAPHYCTDWDVHRDPDLIRPYALLLSVGHDEYWSQSVRMAVSGHVRRGGNVAYLTGNTCFWRIHYTDEDTAITCAKVVPSVPITEVSVPAESM